MSWTSHHGAGSRLLRRIPTVVTDTVGDSREGPRGLGLGRAVFSGSGGMSTDVDESGAWLLRGRRLPHCRPVEAQAVNA